MVIINKTLLVIIILLIFRLSVAAQAGIGTNIPDASAVLELKSTNKGFLLPRMTADQKLKIIAPQQGLLIYQTDGTSGIQQYNGTAWISASAQSPLPGNYVDLTTLQTVNGIKSFYNDIYANGIRLGRGGGNVVSNTAVGAEALDANTTGLNNTGVGYRALHSNTKGYGNSAGGYQSLYSNTTGSYNTANGAEALYTNNDGSYNTANGFQALYSNISGYSNTATGYAALEANTDGYNNTAIGNVALFSNKTGFENTANGGKSLYFNVDGNRNTATGVQALYKNISGSNNTALGVNALYSNATGSFNIGLGYYADVASDNLNYASAIGARSEAACSNCMVLGAIKNLNGATESTKVGAGTFSPQTILHISPDGAGSILVGTNKNTGGFTNLEMGISSSLGGHSFIQSTQSSGSLTYGSLLLNPFGGNVGINVKKGSAVFPLDVVQKVYKTDVYHYLGMRFRNKIQGTDRNWDLAAGDNLTFYFDNGVEKKDKSGIRGTNGDFDSYSDERLKKNIESLGTVMKKVMNLQPKIYEYNNTEKGYATSIGFLAQDLMQLFPELVNPFVYPTKDTTDKTIYYGVNYAGLNVVAIQAIQEQQKSMELIKDMHTTLINKQPSTRDKEAFSAALMAQKAIIQQEQISWIGLEARLQLLENK